MQSRCVALLLSLILIPSTTFAQWGWKHPRPQGHTLYDIVFLDNHTAIGVGECTTVLVTHDAGDSWSVQSKLLGVTAFQAIDRLDANTAVAVGESGLIARTTDKGATWTPISTGIHVSFNDVSFFDALHGIIVGGNTVLRTADGGLTWLSTAVASPLRAVDMTSSTDAYAVGTTAVIVKTTNGGATWDPIPSPLTDPATAPFYSVDFLDPLHGAVGAATGDDGFALAPSRCYVTSDGGNTWSSSDLHDGLTHELFFPNELLYPQAGEILVVGRIECCVLGANDPWPTGEFASTINTGGSWTNTPVNRPALGLARSDDGIVIVVGEDGRMIRRNLDATYTEYGPIRPYVTYGGSSFLDANVGVVLSSDGFNYMFGDGDTYFARTTDGGESWSASLFGNRQCVDVAVLSPTEVLAVGLFYDQGAVLRSTSGGAAWSSLWTGASPSYLRAVAAGSASKAIAVGAGGTALVIDAGVVTPVATGGADFFDVAFANAGVVLAVGTTDARSLDGGQTWGPVAGPATDIRALDFATATRAFGIDPLGILRSEDTGDTWTPVPSGMASNLFDISFADTDHGMAVGSNGLALMTVDGGDSWVPVESPTTRTFTDVSMVAAGHAFVSGQRQVVFEYGPQPVPTLVQSFLATPRPFGAALRWDVVTDDHLSGFTIRRSSRSITRTIASGLAVEVRAYVDDGLVPGQTYEYQLIAVDRDGSVTQSAPVRVTIPTAAVDLLPNQPNPFNPATTIRFVVPEKMRVTVTVHDVAGRIVATLVDATREPGVHGVTWNAEGMASGVYFARLRAGKDDVSRKMVLIK